MPVLIGLDGDLFDLGRSGGQFRLNSLDRVR